jgi:hypothetical protein
MVYHECLQNLSIVYLECLQSLSIVYLECLQSLSIVLQSLFIETVSYFTDHSWHMDRESPFLE